MNISRSISRTPVIRGFTLIEIMIAIALFMMVITAIYSTWAVVMRATQVGQAAAARAQRQRVALNTIESALMSIQSFQSSQKYYSFNLMGGDNTTLSFASRLPDVFPRHGKFLNWDMRRVTFSLESAIGGSKDLVLRQNPILMDMDDDEQKMPLVLAHDVKTFLVECWDTNQLDWVTEWDNTNAIPPMIRVSLIFGGHTETGNSAPDFSIVRTYSIPSSEMPTVVQMGGAGGGFPGGGGGGPPGTINLPGGGTLRRPGQ